MSGKGLKVAVVGGGIVGVSNALALQKAGHQVTLIDRRAPGRETSYGNAGVLSESSVGVLNSPGAWRVIDRGIAIVMFVIAGAIIQPHL